MGKAPPASIAAAFDRSAARRLRRGIADFAQDRLDDSRLRLPHALAWRLRQQVYDRPPPLAVYDSPVGEARHGTRVLLVSHDLSRSGAPQLLVEIAAALKGNGFAVTFAAPADGPLREPLVAMGASVILDPQLCDPAAPLWARIAGAIDVAICNTVETYAAVLALAPATHVIWYLHEVESLRQRLATDVAIGAAMDRAARIWAGSHLSADIVRPVRDDVETVPYGLDPIGRAARAAGAGPGDRPLAIGVFASIEPRKGQDLLVQAIRLLAPPVRAQLHVTLYGRTLDAAFGAALMADMADLPQVAIGGVLDADSYRAAMLACDAVCVPSRDDTLPLVSLDGLGAARLLMCTATTGTAVYLETGVDGFVADRPDAEAIAAMLDTAIAARAAWPDIAEAGRRVFDRAFARAPFVALLDNAVRWAALR